MGVNERAELGQAFLALAGSSEDHWLSGSVQVDEDGDVIASTLGRGLIQADCLEVFQVQRGDGPQNIINACFFHFLYEYFTAGRKADSFENSLRSIVNGKKEAGDILVGLLNIGVWVIFPIRNQ